MSLEKALELLGFLQECKEGQTAGYIDANEVAAGCIKKQLHFQRVINDAVFECFMLAHEE